MATSDTINTVPSAGSSFLADLQAFLKQEDAGRFAEIFTGLVASGGVISPVASLTATPTALVAYPGGYRVTESGSITFTDNETTYVIAHKDTTGNAGTYTRVTGTHYLIDFSSGSEPSLPANSVRIATVTTSGGSITVVVDRRNLFSVGLDKGGTGLDGSAAANGTLLIGNGSGFTLATATAGTGVSVTNGAGSVTIAATGQDTWAVRGNASLVATTTTVTLVASSVVLRNSSEASVVRHNPSNITNTVTTAGPAANGRDQAGAFTASTFIHFYWIWNGTTLASVSSATAPPTGPTLPTGYTHWAYCGAIYFDSGSALIFTRLRGDTAYYETQQSALAAGAATAETAITMTALVPSNCTAFLLNARPSGTGSGGGVIDTKAKLRYVTTKDYAIMHLAAPSTTAVIGGGGITVEVPNVSQTLYYLWLNATNVTPALAVDVIGYRLPNGGA